jgi:hypothetical protein
MVLLIYLFKVFDVSALYLLYTNLHNQAQIS